MSHPLFGAHRRPDQATAAQTDDQHLASASAEAIAWHGAASDRPTPAGGAIGSRRAVYAQESQGGPGKRRVQVRRRAGPGVPLGDQRARARAIRPELPARPARLSLSLRPHAQEAGGGVRGPARERADEARRRDRQGQRSGTWCTSHPVHGEATRPGRGASRSSLSARPISARLRAKTSRASATGGLTSAR